ncbi:TlpA disulfide reductase family protein [Tamlana sp. 2201CG12-4]|uniref:TlpA disulfide reductase family protein n=1 Tax=Tamlana sp. 2201CG12-4 TaxID=3112582 RepID=UPI002DBB45BE|nr:TlpA disulfide reductase family protein [Tamlana sp. 2201CG12-4]MEC3907103.1 TlpA disulfide reductase family protein [Tamlana sp. 2201CG12-4]
MKIIFRTLVIAFLVISIASCKSKKKEAKHDGFYVSGKIIGLDNGTIVSQKDTIALKDGAFTFKGKLEGATNRYFRINDKYSFGLVLANETFNVTVDVNKASERGNISDIEVVGSAINDELKNIENYLKNIPESKKLSALFELSKTLEKGTDTYKKNYEALSEAREAVRKVRTVYIKDYALNNPGSVIAAFYMRMQANEVDQTFEEFEKIVEGFTDEVKKSSFYKPLKDELEGLRRTAVGEIAPDFTLKTDKGEDFTLSSLRGEKIVLVDFWASWCVPCRKSYPHLKEVYKQYKDKGFEVVAVTNDTDHDQWKNAIAEDGLEWIQVADVFPPRDGEPPFTAKVITAYAAPYLPSTYLLDKEGRILAKHLHGEVLDRKLEEIFK